MHVISAVEDDSIAFETGIVPGDVLLKVNGEIIKDVFDYRFQIFDEFVELMIAKENGTVFYVEIEKDFDEDLGIVFEHALMDDALHCKNKCIFCFIDQLPKNMRPSLYFKDDDSRLSFLTGNYVTLTNMSEEDIDRIALYHLSPINISVHATNKDIRVSMLKNPNAANILNYIERFIDAGIEINCQVVLCKNINDGSILDDTIRDLSRYMPHIKSLSVVPVGLTKFRDSLTNLEPFSKNDAVNVLSQIAIWQRELLASSGSRFVFAADEFYLKAGFSFPAYDDYEDFPQLENGVGMISLFEREFNDYLITLPPDSLNREVSIATGEAAVNFIKMLCDRLMLKFINTKLNVYCVKNSFFGNMITVSGLLCGCDIVNELKHKDLGSRLLIPPNTLKSGTSLLLDDVDITWIENKLGVRVMASGETGADFIRSILEDK